MGVRQPPKPIKGERAQMAWGDQWQVRPPKLVYEVSLAPPTAVVTSPEGILIYPPDEVDAAVMARAEGEGGQLVPHGTLSVVDSDGEAFCGTSAHFDDDPGGLAKLLVRAALALSKAQSLESFSESVWGLLTAEHVLAVRARPTPRLFGAEWLGITSAWCAHQCAGRAATDPAWQGGTDREWWMGWYLRRVNDEKPFGSAEPLEDAVFHPNRHHLSELLKTVEAARTGDEKGASLETLAMTLLQWVDGLRVVPSVRSATGQIDLLVRNMCEHPMVRAWGERWLVEAKNWNRKVGTDEVGAFLTDLREVGCSVGVLFSRLGISGGVGRDAWHRVLSAYQRDRVVVIVLTRSDLEAVARGANLVTTMLQRHEDVQLGRVRKGSPQT